MSMLGLAVGLLEDLPTLDAALQHYDTVGRALVAADHAERLALRLTGPAWPLAATG
jgi:hypothetical protein